MKRLLLLISVFLLHNIFGFAQTTSISRLKERVLSASTSEERLALLLLLCEERNSLSADSLYVYANEARKLSAASGNSEQEQHSDYFIAAALEKKGLLDSAFQLVEQRLSRISDKKHSALQSKLMYLKASLLIRKNEFEHAHKVGISLLKIAEDQNDTLSLIAARHLIGWVYMEVNQPSEALSWFRKALQTAPAIRFEQHYVATYANMIASFGMLGLYDSTQYYIDKGILVAEKFEQLTTLCNVLNLKASLYMMTGRNSLAAAPLRRALEIRKQIGDPFYIVADMAQLASFYANAGEVDSALYFSLQGVAIAEENHITGKLPILYHSLAHSYKLKADYKNASIIQEKHLAINDSLYNVNTAAAMAELEKKYQLQKKENTIILQQITLLKREYQLIGSIVVFLVAALAGYFAFRSYRTRQKASLAKAMQEEKLMAALAVQEAEESERRRIAADLHDNLGAYAASIAYNIEAVSNSPLSQHMALRELRNSSEAMVAELGDTIWVLKKPSLHLTAISDRIKVFAQKLQNTYQHFNIEVSEAVSNDLEFPPIQAFHLLRILQEGIINAVKHSRGTNVVVSIASGAEWRVVVEDNGIGLENLPNNFEGNGLDNIKRRAAVSDWVVIWISGSESGTKMIVFPTTNGLLRSQL